jgi:hypothetical protein
VFHSVCNRNEYQGRFWGVKCGRRVYDNSAVLVVPNVEVRMEAYHSIPHLILNDLLGKAFTFTFLCIWFNYSINNYGLVTVVLEEANVKKEAEYASET